MDDVRTLPLSASVRQAISDAPGAYELLIAPARTPARAHALMRDLTPQSLLTMHVASPPHAQAMLAGLWLWNDALHEGHDLAQRTPADADAASSLNFWHAIMHRREGDFFNSKYWYARCRNHPAWSTIAAALREWHEPGMSPADLGLQGSAWNPNVFVDLVEAVHDAPGDPRHAAAVAMQKIEWRCLFTHCAKMAAGVPL